MKFKFSIVFTTLLFLLTFKVDAAVPKAVVANYGEHSESPSRVPGSVSFIDLNSYIVTEFTTGENTYFLSSSQTSNGQKALVGSTERSAISGEVISSCYIFNLAAGNILEAILPMRDTQRFSVDVGNPLISLSLDNKKAVASMKTVFSVNIIDLESNTVKSVEMDFTADEYLPTIAPNGSVALVYIYDSYAPGIIPSFANINLKTSTVSYTPYIDTVSGFPAITMDSKRAILTTESASSSFLFLDLETNDLQEVSLPGSGEYILSMPVVTPDGKKALFTGNNLGTDLGSIFIVNLSNNEVTEMVNTTGNYGVPYITLNSQKAVILNPETSEVTIVDLTNNTVKITIEVGDTPTVQGYQFRTIISPDGKKAIITSASNLILYVIDLTTYNTETVELGFPPQQAWITLDSKRALVIHLPDTQITTNFVKVVDLDTLEVIQDLTVGKNPVDIGVPDTQLQYLELYQLYRKYNRFHPQPGL